MVLSCFVHKWCIPVSWLGMLGICWDTPIYQYMAIAQHVVRLPHQKQEIRGVVLIHNFIRHIIVFLTQISCNYSFHLFCLDIIQATNDQFFGVISYKTLITITNHTHLLQLFVDVLALVSHRLRLVCFIFWLGRFFGFTTDNKTGQRWVDTERGLTLSFQC